MKGTYIPTREALRRALAKDARPVNLVILSVFMVPLRARLLTRVTLKTIINTSSVGSAATWPGFSSYQPGKSAVNRFTEFIHFEYEDTGVRTFAYHPGSLRVSITPDPQLGR